MTTANRPLLAGVIGHPVAHSRSPALHGHWLARYGIAGHYVPLDIAPRDVEPAMRMLPRLGFRGVNVTIPHKEAVLAVADRVSDRAAMIGAANTITFRENGEIHADNTDGYGFLANLRAGAPEWTAKSGPAVVLGAGGAARAVVAALLQAGAPELRLVNRTRPRAEAMAEAFGARVTVANWTAAEEMMVGARTIVNTTSLGMAGQPPLKVGLERADPAALVTDIVYQPLETPFLAAARARGMTAVDGLGMLLHQAAPGFESWFGRRPEVDDALRAAVLGE